MKQSVFFLHSAGPQGPHQGSSDFVGWLKQTLGPDYEVVHPLMPHPEDPDYEPWKTQLKQELSKLPEGEVILVGHSLGGAVLLKYLVEENLTNAIKGLFIVSAPFWGGDENWQYEPFTLPKDFASRLPAIPQLFFYHSQNDPFVPFQHLSLYAHKLPQATVREIEGDEHAFTKGLPELAADMRALQ